jgi:glutamate dehydrogenase (NADP+)
MLMTLKTAAAGLPLGGAKGGVIVNPRGLNESEVEELSRKYVRELLPYIGPKKDILAPDVNTNAKIIDIMVNEYEKLTGDTSKASFTGKSVENGGSLGHVSATGRGGVTALGQLLKHDKYNENDENKELTIAIQGFGNVGAFFATLGCTEHENWKLVAASDSETVVYKKDGLDTAALSKFKQDKGRFKDYTEKSKVELISNEELISLEVDVLVLAALGNVVTEENMKIVKAKYIVEMANGPVNVEAHDYLTEKGVRILPDIIANSGGVVASYLEWVQNTKNEHWEEDKVNQELLRYMTNAVNDLMRTGEELETESLTEAAFVLALKRLEDPDSPHDKQHHVGEL